MSKELVCPFCNKKLEPIGTSGQFQCGTWGCDASFNFYATRDVWEYIDRTRKALDATLDKLKRIRKIYTNAPFNAPINYANVCTDMYDVATEQITAPEQKE